MATLEIHLLGPFQVIVKGEPVTDFGADSARALLAYLVLHPGVPLRRETLAALLWPDLPESDALRALRQALNRVRTAIGDREAESPFLDVTRQTLVFNPESDHRLDVRAFEAHLAATRTHPHRRLAACRSCLHHLRRAVDLYRGDLLQGFHLDSLPFEEWLLVERERRHCQAVEALHAVTCYHETHGDFQAVQHYARRQLELEPWREEAHRQLMRALALTDQQSAALAQYRRCQEVLSAELGVAPAEPTQALFRQLREGTLAPSTPPTNLPLQLGPFVGRRPELQDLVEQLNHPDCRLLTLVGVGGVGKTRLALQVGLEERYNFRDGVFYVPLAALDAPEQLGAALARALNFYLRTGQDPWQELRAYLRRKELLLILDNFEHLLSGAGRVVELLQYAPEVVVLATSRERLSVQGEWVVPVTGMRYPRTEDLTPSEAHGAVRLFLEGAQRVRPGFAPTAEELRAIVGICRLVEGLPLALELAVPWLRVLSCQEIVREIEKDLDFLEGALQDLPDRHRSLRAVFDHSWQLLSAREQRVFTHLSVFRGHFSREAAEAVAGATPALLAALEDQSLLQIEATAGESSRYDLHDLVQRYAAEKLARDPVAELTLRERHAEYYLELAHALARDLRGREQETALRVLDAEAHNLAAAWSWAAREGRPDLLAAAWEGLFLFYDLHSRFLEGEEAFAIAAERLSVLGTDEVLWALIRACQGWFAFRLGRRDEGQILLEEILESLRSHDAPRARAFTAHLLGATALQLGGYEKARPLCREALELYRQAGETYGEALMLTALGQGAYRLGDCDAAFAYCQEGLDLARREGLSPVAADALRHLGNTAYFVGDFALATERYHEALELYRRMGNRWGESAVLNNLGIVASREGQVDAARAYMEHVLNLKREMGERLGEANVLMNLGVLESDRGHYGQALRYYETSLEIKREVGDRKGEGETLNNLGSLYRMMGDYVSAAPYLAEARAIRRETGERRAELRTDLSEMYLLTAQGDGEDAVALAYEALAGAREMEDRSTEAALLFTLGLALASLDRRVEAREAYAAALTLQREMGKACQVVEALAGLAELETADGEVEQALQRVEEVLRYREEHSMAGMDDPFRVYLACYRVLCAAENTRAPDLLKEARTLVDAYAAHIPTRALRRAFLEKVPANRAIVEAYEALVESEGRADGG